MATLFLAHTLPPVSDIRPELATGPIQKSLLHQQSVLSYKGNYFTIDDVADYEIWGLVVSHNDPFVWYHIDISHDKYSLDTRDLCVIWGRNVKTDDYQRISFNSGDWFCGYRYGTDVRSFAPEDFSNNHLITDNDAVRERIANVQIGDQIHIKGRLVNYSDERWDGRFRVTSTTRSDTGNGACEIILVESIDILTSPNELWAKLHKWCLIGIFATMILGIVLWLKY